MPYAFNADHRVARVSRLCAAINKASCPSRAAFADRAIAVCRALPKLLAGPHYLIQNARAKEAPTMICLFAVFRTVLANAFAVSLLSTGLAAQNVTTDIG